MQFSLFFRHYPNLYYTLTFSLQSAENSSSIVTTVKFIFIDTQLLCVFNPLAVLHSQKLDNDTITRMRAKHWMWIESQLQESRYVLCFTNCPMQNNIFHVSYSYIAIRNFCSFSQYFNRKYQCNMNLKFFFMKYKTVVSSMVHIIQ